MHPRILAGPGEGRPAAAATAVTPGSAAIQQQPSTSGGDAQQQEQPPPPESSPGPGDPGALRLVCCTSSLYPSWNRDGNEFAIEPAWSPDGTRVLFTTGDGNAWVDDVATGATTLVTATADGAPAPDMYLADSPQYPPVWSPDGTRVAFKSGSDALIPGADGGIFVKDLRTGMLTLVNSTIDGEPIDSRPGGWGWAWSPDGTEVAFVGFTWVGRSGVYVKDLTTGAATLVSTNVDGAALAGGVGGAIAWSPDGSRLAFYYTAPDPSGDDIGVPELYVKDLHTGELSVVTAAADGTPADAVSDDGGFAWSPDGSKIAFTSTADNLLPDGSSGQEEIYVKDMTTGALALVSSDARGNPAAGDSQVPRWSPDGSRILFRSEGTNLPGAAPDVQHVYVKELATGALALVDSTKDGRVAPTANPTDGWASHDSWSPDGHHILFISGNTNLLPGANVDNSTRDDTWLFVKDITTGELTLASSTSTGEPFTMRTDGGSGDPVWSPDGTQIAFPTAAEPSPNAVGEMNVWVKTLDVLRH